MTTILKTTALTTLRGLMLVGAGLAYLQALIGVVLVLAVAAVIVRLVT